MISEDPLLDFVGVQASVICRMRSAQGSGADSVGAADLVCPAP